MRDHSQPGAPKAVDGGITTIQIAAGATTWMVELWAGRDAPESVWALPDAIDALSRNAKLSTAY